MQFYKKCNFQVTQIPVVLFLNNIELITNKKNQMKCWEKVSNLESYIYYSFQVATLNTLYTVLFCIIINSKTHNYEMLTNDKLRNLESYNIVKFA